MDGYPLVSVGIPTFNRPVGLRRTLEQIRGQTYKNLEILVSDNHSTDPEVQEVIAEAAAHDSRIRAYCQPKNLGIGANFRFVKEAASGAFFMWAADDDGWEPTFVERLLSLLQKDAGAVAAFCNFDVRYPDQSPADLYPPFLDMLRPLAAPDNVNRLRNFILQPERLGKANLFYSLFRKPIFDQVDCGSYFAGRAWGFDMLLVLDVLSRGGFQLCEETLYHVGIAFNNATPSANTTEPADSRTKRPSLFKSQLRYFLRHFSIVSASPVLSPREKAVLGPACVARLSSWLLGEVTGKK